MWQPIAYLVRHCDTGLSDQFRGWGNPSLNEEGYRAADALANYFSYERVGHVYTSDLNRTVQTAQHIRDTYLIDRVLRPWNIGDLAGKKKSDENVAKLNFYVEHPADVPVNGESFGSFLTRVAAIQSLLTPSEYPHVIVTHSSNITNLHRILHPYAPTSELVQPGGVIALVEKEGTLTMEVRVGAILEPPQ